MVGRRLENIKDGLDCNRALLVDGRAKRSGFVGLIEAVSDVLASLKKARGFKRGIRASNGRRLDRSGFRDNYSTMVNPHSHKL